VKEENIVMDENFICTKHGYCFFAADNKNAIIFNLYVYPEYRRQNKAKKLLRLVINEIRENGYVGEIEIQAKPKEESIGLNDLLSFYKSMGLKITG